MSKTIDEKVVSMQFDNKNFEANVKTTMSTIDKLKEKLKFKDSAKSLEEVSKAANDIKFDKIVSGVEALERRFSTFGIVGMRVIENFTDSAMRMASKINSFVLGTIKQGGISRAMNIENARFQLQGLLQDEEAVAAVMKNVSDSVDGTAYSLDAAAKVASQLAASGMRAGDEMFSSLRAVAGVAAMTNSSYEDIGRIFTQVAGQGRLMGDQLLQLSSRGMNAAATLAEHFGTTEAEIRDMVSKGKISFNDFAEAMDDAFGEHAKKANETFNGALSNVKSALSRIGAEFVAPLIEQNGPVVELLNTIREKINDIKKNIVPFANLFTSLVLKLAKAANAAIKNLNIDKAFEKFKSLSDDFGISKLIEKINSLTAPLKKTTDTVKETVETVTDLGDIVNKVIKGDFGNGADRYNALTEAGENYYRIQNKVNETLGDSFRHSEEVIKKQDELLGSKKKVTETTKEETEETTELTDETKKLIKELSNMSDEQLRAKGYSEEQIAALKELRKTADDLGISFDDFIDNLDQIDGKWIILDSLKNIGTNIVNVFKAIGKAWRDVFKPVSSEQLFKVISGFHKLTSSLLLSNDSLDKLKRTFRGLFALLDIVRTIVGGGLSIGFKILKTVLSALNIDILSATANVGDAIYAFRNWLLENNIIVKGIEKLISIISNAIIKVKNFVNELIKIPEVNRTITQFKDNVSSAFSEMHDRFANGGEVISAFIDRCSKLDGISLENIKTIFKDFRDNVLGYFFNFDGVFDNLGSALTNLKNTIITNLEESVDGFTEFKNKVVAAFEYVKSKLDKIQLGHVIAIATGAALLLYVNKFWDIAKLIGSPLKAISDAVTGFFTALGGVLKGFTLNLKAKALMRIAIAIAVLAGAVALLAQLDAKSLWNAVGALVVLAGALVGIMIAMDKLAKNTGDLGKVSRTLLSIGASLVLLAVSLKIIATMSITDVKKGMAVITTFGLLASALMVVSLLAGKNADKAGTMIMKIAASFVILAVAMKIIATMSDDEAGRALGVIGTLELLAIGLVAVSKLAGDSADKAGKMISKIAAAFLILAIVMKIVSGMSDDDLKKGIAVIAVLEILAIGLVAISKLAGDSADKAGSMIMKIAGAFLIMLLLIKIISKMDDEELIKGIAILAVFELLVAGLIAVSKLAGANASKAGTMIMKIAAAFIILAIAMAIISVIDPKGLKKAIEAIAAVSVCFAGLIAVSKFASGAEAAIGKLAIVLAIMAISLAGLSMIDTKNLAAATIALSAVIGMFTLLTLATKALEKVNAKKAVPLLLSLAIIVGILAGIIAALSFADATSTLAAAGSLSALLLSLASSCAILGTVGKSANKALPAALAMSGIVAILAIILGIFASLNLGPTLEIAASLSLLLLSLSTSCLILAAASAVASMASAGVMGLVAVIGVMMILITAIGALVTYVPQIQEFVNNAVPVFTSLGEAIGGFVGGIIGGALSGITDSLPKVASDIATFFDTISTIDSGSIGSAKSVAEMLLIITAAEFLNGISKFVGSNGIDQFGERLVPFAKSINEFSNELSKGTIDQKAVMAAALAGKLMASLEESLPRTGGVVQKFLGEHDMAKFGTDLVSFGVGIMMFSAVLSTGTINEEAITAAANAGKLMASFEESLPRTGGVVQKFLGEHDMAKFGTDLVSFGVGIMTFSAVLSIGTINEEAITTAANAGKLMASLEESLPRTGGVVQKFLGEHDMTKFGTDLVLFGTSIMTFSAVLSIGTINEEAITAAANAGKLMAAMEETIPRTGGVAQFFAGEHDMSKFGTDLVSFGEAITDFSDKLAETTIDESKIEAAANAGKLIAAMEKTIPKTGGIFQVFSGEHNLGDFSTNLPEFGDGIKGFAEAISGVEIDSEKTAAAAKAGSAIAKMAENIPTSGSIFEVFTGSSSLSDFADDLSDFGDGIKNFADATSGCNYESVDAAIDAAAVMIDFMKSNGNSIVDLSDIISYVNNMEWFDTGFVNLGECVTDFSNSVKGANLSNVDSAISSINRLISLAGKISITVISGDKISAFGDQIVSLAKSAKNFAQEASDIDGDQITAAVTQITKMSQALNEASSKSLEGFAKAFDSAAKSGKEAAAKMIKTVQGALTDAKNADFANAGKTVVTRFADGMISNSSKAKTTATTISNGTSSALKSKDTGAYDAGKALVTGFANGITLNTYIAKNAAKSMAEAAVKAAKKALDINSPSKVFRKIGKSVPEGFAQGIDRLGSVVDDSATNMCNNAVKYTSKAIARISNAIESDVNAEPTIRPVLDLSNIANGAGAINGLFNTNPSVGLLSNVGSVSSMMNRRQNGVNNDVVTAINRLSNKLDNVSGNTYTVNGITYDDGSNISDAVKSLIRAARIERRA